MTKLKRVKDQSGREEVRSPIGASRVKEAWRTMITVKDEERMMDGRSGRATQCEPHSPMNHGQTKAENRKCVVVLSFST